MNPFAIIVGAFVGLCAGIFAGFLFPHLGLIRDELTQRCLAGAMLGGLFGGIAGSISGDANRNAAGGHSFLIAFIFGAIFGALGGSKLEAVSRLLDMVHIRHPF